LQRFFQDCLVARIIGLRPPLLRWQLGRELDDVYAIQIFLELVTPTIAHRSLLEIAARERQKDMHGSPYLLQLLDEEQV
jgi:hypothetical protein